MGDLSLSPARAGKPSFPTPPTSNRTCRSHCPAGPFRSGETKPTSFFLHRPVQAKTWLSLASPGRVPPLSLLGGSSLGISRCCAFSGDRIERTRSTLYCSTYPHQKSTSRQATVRPRLGSFSHHHHHQERPAVLFSVPSQELKGKPHAGKSGRKKYRKKKKINTVKKKSRQRKRKWDKLEPRPGSSSRTSFFVVEFLPLSRALLSHHPFQARTPLSL